MVEVIVDFDYDAQEPDELTIRKGDVIRNITMKPDGWWEGTLNDKRGMFPDNFVRVIETDVVLRNKTKKRYCQAVYGYDPEHEDELRLGVGDIIEVLGEIEEGWWKGRVNDKEGVFPSNFVEELPGPIPFQKKSLLGSKDNLTHLAGENELLHHSVPSLPPKPVKTLYQALFEYAAQNDDELSLKEGDLITLISKEGQDKGWWRGELRGRIGVFPDNFVTVFPVPVDQPTNSTTPIIPISKKSEVSPQLVVKIFPQVAPINVGRKDPPLAKPINNVAMQRKSLEAKAEGVSNSGPPIPGKKPLIPMKKSPSLTGGGLLSGLKQKVMGIEKVEKIEKPQQVNYDNIDGIGSSKMRHKDEERLSGGMSTSMVVSQVSDKLDDFDQVERVCMLVDPRANRAKAPGRRPPSMVFRETESSGLTNGNSDHSHHSPNPALSPTTPLQQIPDAQELETTPECKPKPRDWEKHKAPWMDELKLNQAKKTSPLNPSPEAGTNRIRFSSTSSTDRLKLSNEKINDSGDELETSKDSMSKSMSAAVRLRTPTPESTPPDLTKPGVVLRSRNSLNTPVRPQSIHGENKEIKISPSMLRTQTPSPVLKPPSGIESPHYKSSGDNRKSADLSGVVSMKQYNDLEERVRQLEAALEKQSQLYDSRLDEVLKKLQNEIDLRQQLKIEIEKLAQCVTQV